MEVVMILIWMLCMVLGWHIGKNKNREEFGFLMGFLLGALGVLIIALMPPNFPPCKMCGKPKNQAFPKCSFCGHES